MLFNSIEFGLFLGVVLLAHSMLPHRLRWALLLVASYFFYMRWNASYAALLLVSTVVDYVCGRVMARLPGTGPRRRVLLLSLATNLGLLFTFKYWDFFHDSMRVVCHAVGVPYSVPSLEVLLPVGISFYTFQTLSYTIDVYRRRIAPERHFGIFALYVAFFPQLVAGPIERAQRLIPQLRQRYELDYSRLVAGLQLALWGLFKKVVVADRLAVYVDTVYARPEVHGGMTYWLATYAFAFQIYCDFSGYSDIAIGVARMFGIDLMDNFGRPYFATSIREFWRRWHISLSTWLRDYLYVPLGGNRGGRLLTYRNLMLTMLLGGLWHGASWTFIVWGALQGLMLAVSRATLEARERLEQRLGVPDVVRFGLRAVMCFHLVCISWVFFRANTLSDALHIVGGMFSDLGTPVLVNIVTFAHAVPAVLLLLGVELGQELGLWQNVPLRGRRWLSALARYALVFAVVLFGVEGGTQFIYFQF